MRTCGTRLLFALLISSLFSECASFKPRPMEDVGFERRAQTKVDRGIEVSVVALSEKEARDALCADLARHGIQPVWVQIQNHESLGFWIPPMAIDRDYFSPTEAAWQLHGWLTQSTNALVDQHFQELQLPVRVAPNETVSGFVFTNLDEGAKFVSVQLLRVGAREERRYSFLVQVPGFKADYQQVQSNPPYTGREIQNLDEAALRAWVENLPCCVLGSDRKTPGDLLNVVFVGDRTSLFPALARQGWHATEATTSGSVWRTIRSSLVGSPYRYGPSRPCILLAAVRISPSRKPAAVSTCEITCACG